MNGFRQPRKLSKKNVFKRVGTFNNKLEEYSKLSLAELKALYPSLRGSYKMACETIVEQKLNTELEILTEANSKELTKEDKPVKEELDGE